MVNCSVEGCNNSLLNKKHGLCSKHYLRFWRNGHILTKREIYNGTCKVNECKNEATLLGMCRKHYDHNRKEKRLEVYYRNKNQLIDKNK